MAEANKPIPPQDYNWSYWPQEKNGMYLVTHRLIARLRSGEKLLINTPNKAVWIAWSNEESNA